MSAGWKKKHLALWKKRKSTDRYIAFSGKIDIYWSSDMGVFGILENEILKPHPPMSLEYENWYQFALETAQLCGLI